jgi:glycosyltransferase involved in cell wall biosynthesis
VEDDAGFVVPHLDAMAMAEHVIQLAEDRSLRDRLGRGAEKKVRDRYDVSVVAPQILKIIREM